MQSHYVDTFFRELSPVWLNYVAALNGAAPVALDGGFRYLELGCGFATSTVVNAAALPTGRFVACDIDIAHIDGGRRHARALGCTNVELFAESFDEFAARDLPPFDFVVLHGVYSWIDVAARAAVRRIVAARLKPGGLAYVSYNCHPGWAAEIPLRRLLQELAEHSATPDSGVGAVTELVRLAPHLRYLQATPDAAAAIDAYRRAPPNYLAHEFLAPAWQVFYSTDVHAELAEADLHYVGSATLPDNHPPLTIDEPTHTAIAALGPARARQLALDFAVNRRFRRDVFARGEASADQAAVERRINDVVIGCPSPLAQLPTRARVPRGEIGFQADFIAALARLLEHGPARLGPAVIELAGNSASEATPQRAEVARNLVYLLAAGTLMPFAQQTVEPPAGFDPLLERALQWSIEQDRDCVIPSRLAGNGIVLPRDEARVLADWLTAGAEGRRPHCSIDLERSALIV